MAKLTFLIFLTFLTFLTFLNYVSLMGTVLWVFSAVTTTTWQGIFSNPSGFNNKYRQLITLQVNSHHRDRIRTLHITSFTLTHRGLETHIWVTALCASIASRNPLAISTGSNSFNQGWPFVLHLNNMAPRTYGNYISLMQTKQHGGKNGIIVWTFYLSVSTDKGITWTDQLTM